MNLRDMYGNPAISTRGAYLTLMGSISKKTIVDGANFTKIENGNFSYLHLIEAQEVLKLMLTIGDLMLNSVTVNITSVSSAAINFNESVNAITLQLYGTLLPMPVVTSIVHATSQATEFEVAPLVAHRLEVPVLRSSSVSFNSSRRFGLDPGLLATMELQGQNGIRWNFNGTWHSGNHSYVIFFRLPTLGQFSANITLRHPASLQTAQVGSLANKSQGLLQLSLCLCFVVAFQALSGAQQQAACND